MNDKSDELRLNCGVVVFRVVFPPYPRALRLTAAPKMECQLYFACDGVKRRFVHGPEAAGTAWDAAPVPAFLNRMSSSSSSSSSSESSSSRGRGGSGGGGGPAGSHNRGGTEDDDETTVGGEGEGGGGAGGEEWDAVQGTTRERGHRKRRTFSARRDKSRTTD